MQNNFPKIPLILSISFFIFFGLAFFFFFREINIKNEKLQAAEKEWQTEELRREEIKALDQSVKTIEGDRVDLETHFAQSSDIVPFLDTIERLAPEAGAKAEVTSVNITEDHTGLLVGMKAAGTFASLYKFLTLLENSPYELDFLSMDMQKSTSSEPTSKNGKSGGWEVIFKIKLLSFVE